MLSKHRAVEPRRAIWVGFDPREAGAYAVAQHSMRSHTNSPLPIRGLILDDVRERGLYRRETNRVGAQLWDVVSDAPMATEFACARFIVPHLAGDGLALFVDCDVMARKNIDRIFDQADPTKAVMVVKHQHQPDLATKMDGQIQTSYPRKNWSSVCLFNCDHPANRALTVEMVNTLPGRDLHRFCWLEDDQIGELGQEWNWLVGHSDPAIDPAIVHFTDGIPTMPGYENCAFADEWRVELRKWAA